MDTVDANINHAKNVGFHEKYQFFILWALFIVSTLSIGIQELIHDEHNHISYVPIFGMLAIQYIYFSPKYESMVFPCIITLLNTCMVKGSPFGITYRYVSLYYCWLYAVQFANFEDAKTHFTFYGISSLYGLPLISYINNIYKLNLIYKYLGVWILQLIQCSLFWFGRPQTELTHTDWNSKNSMLPLLFFGFSWSAQWNEQFVDINNTFINDLGKIQYGLIGMTVFLSACASLCFKHIPWIAIMLGYTCVYYVLHSRMIPLDYEKPELTVLLSSIKYLIYQPGMYMMFTTQKPYNIVQGFTGCMFMFCLAKMIPFMEHYVTYMSLLGLSILGFLGLHTVHITYMERQRQLEYNCNMESV